jgi:hypothetical protein
MPSSYIGSEDFRLSLNQWLKNRSARDAERINNNKTMIPIQLRNYSKLLYVGMVVDDDFVNRVNSGRGKVDDYMLWTKSATVAKQSIRNQTLRQGQYKILITKVVAQRDQVIDLDELITFMGIPQLAMFGFDKSELMKVQPHKSVLVTNSVNISRSDYNIIEQYGSNANKSI